MMNMLIRFVIFLGLIGWQPSWAQVKCSAIKNADAFCTSLTSSRSDDISPECPAQAQEPYFTLGTFDIHPSKEMPEAKSLVEGLKDYVKSCTCIKVDQCRLKVISGRMNEYLSQKGQPFAKAIIAPQSFATPEYGNGVSLRVDLYRPAVDSAKFDISKKEESTLNKQQKRNLANARQQLAQSFPENSVLSQEAVDNGMYSLSTIPGLVVDFSKQNNTPPEDPKKPLNITPGKSSLDKKTIPYSISVRPDLPQSSGLIPEVWVDNYGSEYANKQNSRFKIGVGLAFSGLPNLRDVVEINYATASNTDQFGITRTSPALGLGDGAKVSYGFSVMSYKVGGDFEDAQAKGEVFAFNYHGILPWIKSGNLSSYVYVTLDRKSIFDKQAEIFTNNRVIHSGRLGGQLVRLTDAEKLFDTFIFSGDVGFTAGHNNITSPDVAELDSSPVVGHSTGGFFVKNNGALHATMVPGAIGRQEFKISGSFQWQVAWNNMDATEKFSLGGPLSVRGYPMGFISGDDAFLANLEFSLGNVNMLSGFFGVDYGRINVYHRPITELDINNTRGLSSIAIGLSGEQWKVPFRVDIGFPINRSQADSRAQLWVRANYKF